MNKKDIMEIKRRFTKESCTFTKLSGCYVNSSKEKIVTFRENFLNLTDDEFFKYLDIAKKTLSGKLNNNLLELEFPVDEEEMGGAQDTLMRLKASHLEDDDILNALYDNIIQTYDKIDNYLILCYHDAYDVPMKTNDNLALDDSDEVYEYIIVAICPVDLSKPGLGYDMDDNKFAALERDWVVGACESAFIFPAFSERSSDIHHTLVYTKNVKEPHKELWEDVLKCGSRYTSFQKKSAFENIISESLGSDEDENLDKMLEIQTNLTSFISEKEEKKADDDEPIVLKGEDIQPILEDSGFEEAEAEKISKKFDGFFEEEPPMADELVDDKLLKDSDLKIEKKELQKQVVMMNQEMKAAGITKDDGSLPEILVRVPSVSTEKIQSSIVDGERYLLIPIENLQEAVINGEKVELN
jgi:hypothetical protein